MTATMTTIRNTLTGKVGKIPTRLLKNRAIVNPEVIVVVEPDAKPYAKATYKPRTAKKFKEDHPEVAEVAPSETTEEKDEE